MILLIFDIEGKSYAIYSKSVERVLPSVEITTLPGAPQIVQGIINIGGKIIPVFDIRQRFSLPAKEIGLTDKFILVHTLKRMIAIIVDRTIDLLDIPDPDITSEKEILPELKYIEGVVKLNNGIILITDLNKFLSINEELELEGALTS